MPAEPKNRIILEITLDGIRKKIREVTDLLDVLKKEEASLVKQLKDEPKKVTKSTSSRNFSEEARQRIREAQHRRWQKKNLKAGIKAEIRPV